MTIDGNKITFRGEMYKRTAEMRGYNFAKVKEGIVGRTEPCMVFRDRSGRARMTNLYHEEGKIKWMKGEKAKWRNQKETK